MCFVCDKDAFSSNLLGQARAAGSMHFAPAREAPIAALELTATEFGISDMRGEAWLGALESDKGLDGLIGTGHRTAPLQPSTPLIAGGPDIGGDTSTTATLTVGAPSIVSTTNIIGDFDFYKVTLTAGKTYEIGMYAKDGGPNGVAHGDAFVEIYGAAGNLIVSADGGASTLRNSINSGFDVLLTYTPETSGTFFVNARAFDQDPVNGTKGDFVGDYELFAREATANAYKPYYDVNSPLYALDWGTQVDRTSRNPDGQEGPRVTGNEFTGVGANPFGITGKNVITYYFARQGEVFINQDPVGDPVNAALTTTVAFGMADWEKGAFRSALDSYQKFADVVFVEVANRNEADFKFITYNGTPNVGVLGRMSPPNENQEGQAEFNRNGPGWNENALVQGGFSNITLIHEVGHGMGMAHPHDNGGRSGIMRGVVADTGPGGTPSAFNYTNGDFDLNQGIHTMMSYESGWEKSPYGQASTQDAFGWEGGPMAFDIAVLQDKYGVNEEWATGNDTYMLKDVNAKGTFYEAVWDAAGNDTIAYSGARNATIDLRPATLKYETGGGGNLSYAFGIHGGFTIANGVTIENAVGGSGADTIFGNSAVNILIGGAGADTMTGLGGSDQYLVDNASDRVFEAAGGGTSDIVFTSVSYTLLAGQEIEELSAANAASTTRLDLMGNELSNRLYGNAGVNVLIGCNGVDFMSGLGGNDQYSVDHALDQVVELAGGGYDIVFSLTNYTLAAGVQVEELVADGTGSLNLFGNELANAVYGNAGANVLGGGGGNDTLFGGGGADSFVFNEAFAVGGVDRILDFLSGTDKIALDDSAFAGLASVSASNFVTSQSGAQDADDRVIYDNVAGALFFDADGNGAGAAVLFATLTPGLPLNAADFVMI